MIEKYVPKVSAGADITWHLFKIFVMIILTVAMVAGLSWCIFVTMIKPHTNPTPTTTESAQVINHTEYYPNQRKFFLGIHIFGVDVGIVKDAYPTKPVVQDIVNGVK